jgi:hypothetical protein
MARDLPDLDVVVTYAAVGGTAVDHSALQALRRALRELAREHGMPDSQARLMEFDGRAARMVREMLPMSAHEASQEEVWSYLTCCWLLDVAVWRFGATADQRRFIGNVNRNTFRRLWWRAEVLGPEIDLARLGEDELVNIMERPTIASDARLARTVARTFLHRLDDGPTHERMMLMREAMKRLLRLTPFVAFGTLDDDELGLLVGDVFDAAAAGLAGEIAALPVRAPGRVRPSDPDVVEVPRLVIAPGHPGEDGAGPDHGDDFETVAQVAVDIARRTGRVTNSTLREVAAISAEEAREVFRLLMERGELVRCGVKRGTHYIVPDGDEPRTSSSRAPGAPPTGEGALRRLLRRRR